MILALLLSPVALAEEQDDWQLFGFEGEKLFNLGSSILAAALLFLTAIAYHRTKQKRLLWVSLAFFLFAVKSALPATELFFSEWPLIDPVAAALDFAILAAFFVGLLKK